MPVIKWTQTFRNCYVRLPVDTQKKVKKTLRFLANDPRHPSLRSKPVKGAPGIYEASVDIHYRLTYERLAGDVLRLRVVGKHDDALKRP